MALVRGGITVKPHVQRFCDDAEDYIGVELSIGTYPGHSPPEGPSQAVDIFNTVDGVGYAQQDQLCEFFIANVKKYGGRYCIRRSQIWNVERADEGWRWQTVYGNVTKDHKDHSHHTFYASGGVGINQPSKPTDQFKEMEKMSFLIGFTSGEHKGQVWLWDSSGRIWTYVGEPSAQRVAEKAGVVYAGDYEGKVWEYWNGLAGNAGFTG